MRIGCDADTGHIDTITLRVDPGYTGPQRINGAEAQSILREILSQTGTDDTRRNFAGDDLPADVEQRASYSTAEARRLRSENSRAATTEAAAINQRLARVEAENRQLRESLADAEAKLEAITSIERSIREQSGEQRSPIGSTGVAVVDCVRHNLHSRPLSRIVMATDQMVNNNLIQRQNPAGRRRPGLACAC